MGGERLDTRNPTSKLMLTILAGVATWEREIMKERQKEGIAKAKAEGLYKGRPASLDGAKVRELAMAGVAPAKIARDLGIARSSVYRLLNDQAEAARDVAVAARRNRRIDPGAAIVASAAGHEAAMLAEGGGLADARDG